MRGKIFLACTRIWPYGNLPTLRGRMNQLGDLRWQSTYNTSVLIHFLCSTIGPPCDIWSLVRAHRACQSTASRPRLCSWPPWAAATYGRSALVGKAAAREHAPRWRPRLSGQRRPFFARRKVEEEEEGEGRKQVRRAQVAFWLVFYGGRKKASFFSSQASRSEAAVAPRGFR